MSEELFRKGELVKRIGGIEFFNVTGNAIARCRIVGYTHGYKCPSPSCDFIDYLQANSFDFASGECPRCGEERLEPPICEGTDSSKYWQRCNITWDEKERKWKEVTDKLIIETTEQYEEYHKIIKLRKKELNFN